jgi:hypothetical protein
VLYVDPSEPPTINDLGPATGKSMRGLVDAHMAQSRFRKAQHHVIHNVAPERAK